MRPIHALAMVLSLLGCHGGTCPAEAPVTRSGAPTNPAAPAASAARSRADVARALAQVEPGMSADQVAALLGAPDDIRTARDPGGIAAARTVEVWRWGTNAHLGFGTLGTVHVQADRTVQYVFGAEGAPPDPALIDEAELQRLLRVVDRVPSYSAPHDARRLIEAVNALQPLGRDRALAVLREYLRVSSDLDDPGRDGSFLLMRTLFEVPATPGYLPVMMVGGPSPPAPADPRTLPRFPIVIVDDIPLRVVSGYALAGMAEQPEAHLAYFEQAGVLRAQPLSPPADPRPTFQRIAGALHTAWLKDHNLDHEWGRALILEQGERMVAVSE